MRQGTEAARPVPNRLHQIITVSEYVISVRTVGCQERRAINKIAEIAILFAVLGEPTGDVRVSRSFGELMNQVVSYCVHSNIAIGAGSVAEVDHVARAASIQRGWRIGGERVLDVLTGDDVRRMSVKRAPDRLR